MGTMTNLQTRQKNTRATSATEQIILAATRKRSKVKPPAKRPRFVALLQHAAQQRWQRVAVAARSSGPSIANLHRPRASLGAD